MGGPSEKGRPGIDEVSEVSTELKIEKRWLLRTLVDPNKFILFYDKYYDRIYKYLYRLTLDPDQAKDLTAETFLKAQQHMWRFIWKKVSFGSWLYKIATNEFRSHLRNRKKRGEIELAEDFHPGSENHPLAQILMEEEQRVVYREVMGLEQPGRDVFLLHYWEGQTVNQISYILKIPEGTVKTHLSRGRDKLKKRLRAYFSGTPVSPFGLKEASPSSGPVSTDRIPEGK